MKPELLEYESLAEFDHQLRKDILDLSNINEEGVVHIKKLLTMDENEIENFWGWKLAKNNTNYLFLQNDNDGNKLRIKDVLPIVVTKSRQVSDKGKVYQLIVEYKSVKFKPEQSISFKELVDRLDSIPHKNHEHRKILVFTALTQIFTRAYFRLSTPPGFGKDSINDTLKHLIGRCGTITNPTVARLEQETVTTDWLAITEITKIPKSKWAEDELFLLDCAAHKPSTNKRSKANGIVGDVLTLRDFSISLFYNDLTNSRNLEKYIDFFADDQLLDRFIPLRLYGTFNYTFEKSASLNIPKVVADNREWFMEMIYTLTWYKEHYAGLQNKYDTELSGLGLSNRQLVSAQRLFKTISFYCDSQEEYDYWISVVKNAIIDYRMMIQYPKLLDEYSKGKNKLSKEYQDKMKILNKQKTFIERAQLLDQWLRPNNIASSTSLSKSSEWW